MSDGKKQRNVTLVLGGGGARGLSHLGVMEVLLKAGYRFDRIVGLSIGSLVGGMFAFNPDIKSVQEKALSYLLSPAFLKHQQTLFGAGGKKGEETHGLFSWYFQIQEYLKANRIFRRIVTQPGMLPGMILKDVANQLLADKDLDEAVVPLTIVAADLHSGHLAVLEKGPLGDAVRGSSALPGIFPPIAFEEMRLIDSGNFYSFPTTVARSYTSDFVLGIEVSASVKPLASCDTAIEALVRSSEIGENFWRKQARSAADFIINPNVADVEWFDFSKSMELIERGRKAGRKALKALDQKWNEKD